jgi:hypothetical protein
MFAQVLLQITGALFWCCFNTELNLQTETEKTFVDKKLMIAESSEWTCEAGRVSKKVLHGNQQLDTENMAHSTSHKSYGYFK